MPEEEESSAWVMRRGDWEEREKRIRVRGVRLSERKKKGIYTYREGRVGLSYI